MPTDHSDKSDLTTLMEIRADYQNRVKANTKLLSNCQSTEAYRKLSSRLRRYSRYISALDGAIHMENVLTTDDTSSDHISPV